MSRLIGPYFAAGILAILGTVYFMCGSSGLETEMQDIFGLLAVEFGLVFACLFY